jgi:NAD(P)-dependent dehydrogenase (short-subunit alcohol dehydrogenase family)
MSATDPRAAAEESGPGPAVALVTSGTFGLGAEIVRHLHGAGTRVAVGETPRHPGNGRSDGPAASLHQGILSSPADCERVVKEVVDQHGRLDILVCLAVRRGLSLECPIERYGAAEWDHHISAYLSGPFYLIRAALTQMLAQGTGRIVTVVPMEGNRGSVGQALTGVAAAGLGALTRRLAREIAGRGVTVNTVVAGLVESGWTLDEMPGALADQVRSSVPAGRLGDRSEVARTVAHLCAPEAGYITGQVIAVDGGFGA